jgi:AcrR family transcriptional regulator
MGLREKQKAERRDQILDSARRLIRATGGTDFSMRLLAEDAEVGLVTPYNLFGSKSGVLYALLNATLERLDRVVDVRSPAKAVDAVLQLADRAADIYARDAAFHRPLMQFLLGVRGGLLPQSVDRDLLARQLLIGFIGVVELWIHEEFDDDAFRAQSMYGSALLMLAHAAPAARPRLLARLRALERRLPRQLANQTPKQTRKRRRAA